MSRDSSAVQLGAADSQIVSGQGEPAHDLMHDADARDGDERERQTSSEATQAIKAGSIDLGSSRSPHDAEALSPSSQDLLPDATGSQDNQTRVTTTPQVSTKDLARAFTPSQEPDPGKSPKEPFRMHAL